MEFNVPLNKRGRRGWPKGLYEVKKTDRLISEGTLVPLQEGVDTEINKKIIFRVEIEGQNSIIVNPIINTDNNPQQPEIH